MSEKYMESCFSSNVAGGLPALKRYTETRLKQQERNFNIFLGGGGVRSFANLQLLMVEIFNTKNNLNLTFMINIVTERDVQYNLRSKNHLQLPSVRIAKYGIENIQHIGHYLWASLPDDIKDSGTLINFKQKIETWKGSTCICRLCKILINEVGFL